MRAAFNRVTEPEKERIGLTNNLAGYQGFLAIVGIGDEREAVLVVEDEALATVLNPDGFVIVGGAVYKYGRDKVVKDARYDDSRLAELGRYRESLPAEGIEVIPFEQRKQRVFDSRSAIAAQDVSGSCLADYWHGGSLCCKKRVVGEVTSWVGPLDASFWYRFDREASAPHVRHLVAR